MGLQWCKYNVDGSKDCYRTLDDVKLVCVELGYWKEIWDWLDYCHFLKETIPDK